MEKQSRMNVPDKLTKIVVEALRKKIFSACSIGYFTFKNNIIHRKIYNYGYTEAEDKGRSVDNTTVYDLASLTKPLVTVLAIMTLVERGIIRLEDELGRYFSELRPEMSGIRLSMLLSHSSGLPAHRPYFTLLGAYPHDERKQAIVRLIGREALVFLPGSGTLYSDLGFILLGSLVEKLTGKSLADFWKAEIAQPMGLQAELFFPGPEGLGCDVCAATGVCSWSKRRLCGIVHDDNCRMLDGVAGHAGLFGTVAGVLGIVENLLLQYRGITIHPGYSGNLVKEFLTKKSGSTWTYGFDTPTSGMSSSGRLFSEKTVGHLGFTGTSFWLDLSEGIAIVLLTNRVLMRDDPTLIRKLRPVIHDTLMESLLEKNNPTERKIEQSG